MGVIAGAGGGAAGAGLGMGSGAGAGAGYRLVTVLICALGGEGGGVLAQWLVDVARQQGCPAQGTSIPGVAQRTGATTYYLEFALPVVGGAAGAVRPPVFSLYPAPGGVDVLLSSELLETCRQISLGLISAERTLVLSSSARVLTTAERMPLGDGRVASAPLIELIGQHSRARQVFDMSALAREHGTLVSAVMLGAIAASGVLPFARSSFEAVLAQSGAGRDASLRGFAAGWQELERGMRLRIGETTLLPAQELKRPRAPLSGGAAQASTAVDGDAGGQREAVGLAVADGDFGDVAEASLPAKLRDEVLDFPVAVRERVMLGLRRVVGYQDAAYGAVYLQRLRKVLAAESAVLRADPIAEASPVPTEDLTLALPFAITAETARWLALWMAFDDVIKVARLKARAARWQRVRREVKAGEHDVVKLYDHFKPGVPEIAGVLPQALAQRLLAWERARVARGQPAWAMPLKIGTHTVTGMLALRLLGSMRAWRPHGSRFAQEQQHIGAWLQALETLTRRDWACGYELAQCGRLIKGYGSTYERGKHNLMHLIGQFAQAGHSLDRRDLARALERARKAALTDEAGKALDQVLVHEGLKPRPVRAQPIHWVRKKERT